MAELPKVAYPETTALLRLGYDADGVDESTPRELPKSDPVAHPMHYTSDPSGVECIQITRHRNFNVGNAIKYLWRAGLKSEEGRTARGKQVEDLRKAQWYIADEIDRLAAADRKGGRL